MRFFVTFCLAATVLTMVMGPELASADLVCGSKYCEQHPCTTPVAASSCPTSSSYRANHAGKCACCPACVTLLSKGDACKTYSKELGETPNAVCREPLRCVAGKCEEILRH